MLLPHIGKRIQQNIVLSWNCYLYRIKCIIKSRANNHSTQTFIQDSLDQHAQKGVLVYLPLES